MSGFPRMCTPGWFYALITASKLLMPKVREKYPDATQEWLLAYALSEAYSERDTKTNHAEQAQKPNSIGHQ